MPSSPYVKAQSFNQADVDEVVGNARRFTRIAIARRIMLYVTPSKGRAEYRHERMTNGRRSFRKIGDHPSMTVDEARIWRASNWRLRRAAVPASNGEQPEPIALPEPTIRLETFFFATVPNEHVQLFKGMCEILEIRLQKLAEDRQVMR